MDFQKLQKPTSKEIKSLEPWENKLLQAARVLVKKGWGRLVLKVSNQGKRKLFETTDIEIDEE